MKTKLTALVLAMLMLLSLAACGEKKEDEQDLNLTEKPTYDYDLSEYITLPEHSALEVSCRLIAPTERDIEAVIEEETCRAGTSVEKIGDVAAAGDRVTYDSLGTRKSDGAVFEEGTARTAIIGGLSYLEGFTENFIGHTTGEVITLIIPIPPIFTRNRLQASRSLIR